MNIRTKNLWSVCAVAGLLAVAQSAAHAQAAIQPVGNGNFYVELKDATLFDALEMIFKATSNPAYLIDPAAKSVTIGSVFNSNIAAEKLILQLLRAPNYLLRKSTDGTTIVEPRAPRAPAPGVTPPKTTTPKNPFGAALETTETTTIAQAQVAKPATAAGAAAPTRPPTTTGRPAAPVETDGEEMGFNGEEEVEAEKEYRAVIIRHVYAGGIAKLFAGGTVITTDQMVSPKSAGGGGGGGFGGGGLGGISGYGNQGGINPSTGLPYNNNGIGGGINPATGQPYNNTGIGGIGGIGGGIGGIGGGIGGIGGGIGGIGGILSDRNLKENFSTVDALTVLDQVVKLPIQSWNYKQQGETIRHIGPMAQDFAEFFGVGEDDRRISAVDANGVTLASIQALYQITLQQSEQIKALQQELAKLQAEKLQAEKQQAPAAVRAQ